MQIIRTCALLSFGLLSALACDSGSSLCEEGFTCDDGGIAEAGTDAAADPEVNPAAMRIGEVLEIPLDANSSTGYTWEVQSPTDASVLELLSFDFVSSGPPEAGTGSGGTQLFRFRATGMGNATILLHYRRTWETEPPANVFRQDVMVVE